MSASATLSSGEIRWGAVSPNENIYAIGVFSTLNGTERRGYSLILVNPGDMGNLGHYPNDAGFGVETWR